MRANPDLTERGTRMPVHTGSVQQQNQELRPWFAAPLRPMETLKGIRIDGLSEMRLFTRGTFAPLKDVEVAVWKIPISTLGDEFIDMITTDAEDFEGSGTSARPAQTGVPVSANVASDEGHLSGTPAMRKRRTWAGEIGDDSADPGILSSRYVQFVSRATYRVAETFYEMEDDPIRRTNVDYMDGPPAVSDHIRTATYSGVEIDTHPDQIDPVGELEEAGTSSLTELAERLSILTRANVTYAEWLEGYGVDVRRVSSIPEPVFIARRQMHRLGSPQVVVDVEPGSETEQTNQEGEFRADAGFVGTSSYAHGDLAGLQKWGTTWRVGTNKNFIADEPSILLGTVCFWNYMHRQPEYAHMMDITRMFGAGPWGHPGGGGLREEDFLTAQTLRSRDGTFTQGDRDNEGGVRAMNLLNLYLHGDAYVDQMTYGDMPPFEVQAINDPPNSNSSANICVSHLRARMAIATDLVG